MVSICARLVTVDKESNIIRLVHQTTQEYFEREQGRWFPNAENKITKTCIAYLSFDAFDSGACTTNERFQAREKEYALYHYPALNWVHHGSYASMVTEPEVKSLVLRFLESKAKILASLEVIAVMGKSQELPSRMTALHRAAYFGLKHVVETLLNAGNIEADSTDEHSQTPLSWAAENEHETIVKLLLHSGRVDVDLRDAHLRSPLSYAAKSGYLNVVETLIDDYHASTHSVDSDGSTPLIEAAIRGHAQVVDILLRQKDVRVNWGDNFKETALYKAAGYSGDKTIIAALLSRGAKPNKKDCEGNSALSTALLHKDMTIAKFLLDTNNISVNTVNKMGRTPLMYAAREGDIEMVELLIKRGARINARDNDRRTPLSSHAAERGMTSIVKQLLDRGVNMDVLDRSSRTAWSYAKQRGHNEIVKCLEDTGAFGDCLEFFQMLRMKHQEVI